MKRVQTRYERSCDAKLRRESKIIKAIDYVFVRVEKQEKNEHRHKLAALTGGPYQVIETKNDDLGIEKATNQPKEFPNLA